MKRNGTVVVLAHCILNVNAKVKGLARYAGANAERIEGYLRDGAGMMQLPCPELAHLGMKRWGMTREQYDVPAYRRRCREILGPLVDQVESLVADGCRVLEIVGIDGSPNCGVNTTCFGFSGGEPIPTAASQGSEKRHGRGVFMLELAGMLAERGLSIPFSAIDE